MIYNIFSNISQLGLDVQPDGLRLVRLKKTRKGYLCEAAFMQPLPRDVVVDGKLKRFDYLQLALADLVLTHALKGLPVAITLAANMVRAQQIPLPCGLSDADIVAEILIQLRRDLPGMTDPVCVDFSVAPSSQAGMVDVTFVAVREAYLTQYVHCVNAAGLTVRRVDVDRYALQHAQMFPRERITLASTVDDSVMAAQEWQIACGAALQAVPRW